MTELGWLEPPPGAVSVLDTGNGLELEGVEIGDGVEDDDNGPVDTAVTGSHSGRSPMFSETVAFQLSPCELGRS